MKLSKILTGILLIISSVAFAQSPQQDSLFQIYYKYPKQAIQDAKKLYQQAIQTHNNPLLIKSLILKTTFTLQIDQDEYPKILEELEKYINDEQDLNTKSILHSYVGQLYKQYYRNNWYSISQRTELAESNTGNIETWSQKLFKEKIFGHLLASLIPAKNLQQTPISNYKAILLAGGASDSLRPTLYDFLCQRAISLLTSNNFGALPSEISSEILASEAIFTKTPIEATPLNGPSHILKIYQDLLIFRQKANNPAALLIVDLERLNYAQQVSSFPSKDSIYLSTIQEIKKQYISQPIVVEIMAKEAEYFLANHHSISPFYINQENYEKKANIEKALAICEEGIHLYPQYNRINLLRKIKESIIAPNISTQFPKTIYPGEKLPVKISSKNIRSINISLFQFPLNIVDYQALKNKKGANIPKIPIFQKNHSLTSDLVLQDTTLQLTVPQSGLYEVVIKINGTKQKISANFISTQLYTLEQGTARRNYFQVCDWQSGKPIKDAKILIYQYRYPSYTIIDSIYTDSQGIATYHTISSSQLFYQTIDTNNPNGYIKDFYPYSKSQASATNIQIITDRKIYRPGQTVYYKGISWEGTLDSVYALNKKTYEISFRDANFKEIARQQVISNHFGSFTGSFVIPQQTLNGYFTLHTKHTSIPILVTEYKRPEFKITFSEPKQAYFSNDTIHVKGKISSFSGINLGFTTIKYEINRFLYYYRMPEDQNNIHGTTQTNANGEFEITFVAQNPGAKVREFSPYNYEITATVTDSKGETQKSSLTIPIYSGSSKPIINIPEKVNKNQRTAFKIALPDLPAQIENRTIQYSLDKLITPKTLTESIDTTIEKNIFEGQLRMHETDSIFPNLQNLASGAYLFTVHYKNRRTQSIFYLYSSQDKRPPIPTYNWLIKEKTSCKPGETARIQFGTSAQQVYLRYQIFASGKLLQQKFRVVSNEIINIDIPYLSQYGSEIFLCISYVKDKQFIQEIIPIHRIRENATLTIETKVFRDKLQPGQKEEWTLTVRSNKNTPAIAEVLAMMYDASLDQLIPYHIHLQADYYQQPFLSNWNTSYFFNSYNYPGLSAYSFNLKNYPIPPFHFDQLNLYQHFVTKLSEFGEYAAEETIEDRGDNTLSNNTVVARAASTMGYKQNKRKSQLPEIEFRKKFQETAFFYPQLKTDTAGNIQLKFQIPESLTKWKFIALATTPTMAVGKLERYITTSKPLMVRPNLPRFLRSGDQCEIKITISNLSDTIQNGISQMEFIIPESNKIIYSKQKKINIPPGQSTTLSFDFNVPANTDLVICRTTALSGQFSDGEQNFLPILPNETLITETLPIFTNKSGSQSFSLQDHSTHQKDYRLTLELTANPIWYAVLALPMLTEPANSNVTDIAAAYYVNTIANRIAQANPQIIETIRTYNARLQDPTLSSKLEQNKELKSILLEASPWVLQAQNETERIQTLVQLFDQNRLSYLQNEALQKLAILQSSDGGWSWFKGMPSNRFMTLNVLTILSRTNTSGQKEYGEKEKIMQMKALRYLDQTLMKDFQETPKTISYNQILYLYVRSLYRDIPLGDALSTHKYFISLLQKQWSDFSLYEKAITAITLKNYGMTETAHDILKSLRQYAIINSEAGMYWPNNKNKYYRNSAVQTHTAILEAFREIEGDSQEINQMKQWLLKQKQVQNWGSVPATVDAIYALLLTGNDQLSQQDQLQIKLGRHTFATNAATNPLGYLKQTFGSEEIKPDMTTVQITKQFDTPTYGGLYLQYFEKMGHIKEQKTDLSINKKLYIAQNNKEGKTILMPLDKHPLKVGDQVIVRLTISLNRDMEYLHLKDLRAACFEPVEQLSGIQWKFGTSYYQDVKDAVTNFFFTSLARGTYVIEYPLWVNQAGRYQDGIATLQSIYAPEFNAFSTAEKIEIENKD